MRCVLIENGVIRAVANAATRPSRPGWAVVSDSFPGKVGDRTEAFGKDLQADYLHATAALAEGLAASSEEELAKARRRSAEARVAYEAARLLAQESEDLKTRAVREAERAYAEAAAEAERLRGDFDRANAERAHAEIVHAERRKAADEAVEREARDKADAAREAAYADALARAKGADLSGLKTPSGGPSGGTGGGLPSSGKPQAGGTAPKGASGVSGQGIQKT